MTPLMAKLDEIEMATKSRKATGMKTVLINIEESELLTHALRLAIEALEDTKQCLEMNEDKDEVAIEIIYKAIASITQLGLGEGGTVK